MNLFGIGPLELLLIFLLIVIIFGPQDLQKTGKALGKTLNKMVKSEEWQAFKRASREIQLLPNKLMREANLEEMAHELDLRPATVKPTATPPPPPEVVLPSPDMPAPVQPPSPSDTEEGHA
jgi:Sec-independent protein translocase protein TatA